MTIKTLLGAAAVAGLLLSPAAAAAQDTKITWKGAPEFSSGDWTFKPRGRVFLDFVGQEVDGGASVADASSRNTRVRTARLGVQGSYTDKLSFVAEGSFINGEATWDDLFLEFAPTENIAFTLGNIKTVSLENLTSSRYTTFMERGPLNDILGLSRTLSVVAATHGERWSAMAAVSGDNINELDTAGDEMFGASARLTLAPVVTDAAKVHLGGWLRRRDRGDDESLRYRARPNTNFGARYLDTGAIGIADTTLGLEGAAVFGSVSVQAEYGRLTAERTVGDDVTLDTAYAFVSWFPTGETRPYDAGAGEFGRVKIRRPVTASGMGAVELAVRYDQADLTEAFDPLATGSFRAGEYRGVTLGVNWYPVTYVRFMANYTHANNDSPMAAFDADADTFQLRAQFDF
jgi:phosphate-selective porin OprO/OprP